MRQFRIQTEGAVAMLAQPPQKKIADQKTQQQSVDHSTGELLMTVDVLYIDPGERPEVIRVTVPESGVTSDLQMGTHVALTGLVARPWEVESEYKGKKTKRQGIGFHALVVTALDIPAAKTKAA